MNAHRVIPESVEGLGVTYHSDSSNLCECHNKFNWKCGKCGKVFLNRWKAQECCFEEEKMAKRRTQT